MADSRDQPERRELATRFRVLQHLNLGSKELYITVAQKWDTQTINRVEKSVLFIG
jgi:hypothetical protein